ncbi:hypothetical protein N5912_10050 [Arcobacter lacus]|uniref:hypothetical protein n=1 Tax=Arcobacteraceae TaxID=2808963 RepID=UPI0021B20069|nr:MULTISPECIES: hypothetical protein [Arcobacteraceae]MCT7536976.1 hypothetical protein [Aliarcobacter butzleri]MCT7623456.1 hypothetical protein [Aliarcobacter butzleri]MCT7912170.1 hypothetical protein [Arcobacter lacus]
MKNKKTNIYDVIMWEIKLNLKKGLIHSFKTYKYTIIMLSIVLFIFFLEIKAFLNHQEMTQNSNFEALITENKAIEQNIKNQILMQKAEEIGVKPLENPNITDYLNLYLQKGTIIWDFSTNEETTYNGQDVVVKAVKIQNGNTVFSINNKQYYVKE